MKQIEIISRSIHRFAEILNRTKEITLRLNETASKDDQIEIKLSSEVKGLLK
jgi:hypothetical protein